MGRFAVISGFLGSGKTTAMMALLSYMKEQGKQAAMISNDLGQKVTLADHRLAALSGVNSQEITKECICFCHEVLGERLDQCFEEGCGLVLSDIPGFGVGALEHVYHGLSARYPGRYELGPFTVLLEPENGRRLMMAETGAVKATDDLPVKAASPDAAKMAGEDVSSSGSPLSPRDNLHILRAQLQEADLIVLSKADLLSAEEKTELLSWLSGAFPEAKLLSLSARTGEGIPDLSEALLKDRASLRHPPIDYEDRDLLREMDQLSEYYLQYHAQVCCRDFDGTAYLEDIAAEVQRKIREKGFEVPHLKLLAWEPEGDFGKVDLIGADRPVEITRRFQWRCTGIAVVCNASAACPAAVLDEIITGSVKEVSRRYQLELLIFHQECFGMGEEDE